MAILSNKEIETAIEAGNLTIDPPPEGPPESKSYDECSVHLHLDDTLHVPKNDVQLVFDLDQRGDISQTLKVCFDKQMIPNDGWKLKPGGFVLGTTREKVGFPMRDNAQQLAGRIEGRSRFARVGLLVHFTAPTLHANWTGNITLEIKNLGELPVILHHGSAICQLIVETVTGEIALARGDFDNQGSATGQAA